MRAPVLSALSTVLAFAACSSSGSVAPDGGGALNDGGGASNDGGVSDANGNVDASAPPKTGPCTATPGSFAPPECDSSTGQCIATPGCTIDETKCGLKSTCLPMASNQGKTVQDFRLRRVTFVAPNALAQVFIQRALIDQSVSLDAKTCGELGDGGFNWLLRVDRNARSLKTGGAPPVSDPFGAGYCFDTRADSLPQTTAIALTADTFEAAPIPSLGLPVYTHGSASSLMLLPMRELTLRTVTISAGGDCIGSFNATALDSTCADSRDDCSKWRTDGSFGGFITLEDADKVTIADLGGKSLCVMLTASTPGADGLHCQRDGNGAIAIKGDYCSTTQTPGACGDSYWTTGTFAASAVKICP